ncbi:putative copper-importing P-type ATPase A [Rhodobacteraceae bacterium THAF1]|uniref:heavy metal translocating P-type ATPase n=1 Tax=Palleronia sp. THAF1 TaxID=2587842 RepID=UPI000F40EFBC|nr:heavy metal translocating P-type ATPase [Palleronia sp. THAF1]QFU08807.1 putative copper-importing P-type ATPase A [Palleronia sp. THAF1]VDC23942.1 putative copper-importing P-type ATPase A [Rhodobacteraceae bacterium THAF1]
MTAACPACAALPPPSPVAPSEATHLLHLPDIHCGGCIASVERTLIVLPGVASARVNLTLKRVSVQAPGLDANRLIDALAQVGHRAERLDGARLGPADTTSRDLLTRIGVSGFALMNVMLLSVAVWSGATGVTAHVFHLISASIAIPAVAYAGHPFFRSALRALAKGYLNMDVPISLAIILASVASLASALGISDRAGWFDAALALTFFLLVGRYLDRRGRAAARSAAAELAALEAPQARRIDGALERIIAADALQPGDLIRLRPGDRLPADGTIVTGRTDLDRSILTGESRPEAVGPGDNVTAGETSLTGVLTVRVDRAGRDTSLARIAEIVATAESQRSRHTGIADRAARVYAPAVHLLGALTFLGWLLATGDGWQSLDIAISVLVITCPCALGLAVPAVSTVATARLFREGILVKSQTALERLSQIDCVALDKTGTLTTGTPVLDRDVPAGALSVAAGLAQGSSHPVSRAIVAAANERGITPADVRSVVERPGDGVEGRLDGHPVRLGRGVWVGASTSGATWLAGIDERPVPMPTTEMLAADAVSLSAALQDEGKTVTLLSGDAPHVVARIAGRLGIVQAKGALSPSEKVDWVTRAGRDGKHVLMVGDGLNDTASLAAAHASIAPGTALDAARNAADVVLLSGGLKGVSTTLTMARLAVSRMRQNIALALAYNVIAVPLAIGGLATPLWAALAMSTSSLVVTLNAMRPAR